MEGCFMFQWGASFLSGGDHGGASVLVWGWGGGGGSKKVVMMFPPTMGNSEQYPCADLLNCLRSIGTIFITTEID